MLYELKKILSALLLPPGIFALFFFIAGAALCLRRRLLGGVATMLMALLLWLLSTGTVAGLLCLQLERGLAIPGTLRGDVIILMGGGTYDGVPDLTGRGTPSDDMLPRVVTAARAYRKLHVPMLVTGRDGSGGLPPEQQPVRRFLVDLGVPGDKIILEGGSRDTAENARNSRDICARKGFRAPLLVTSAFHMRRAQRAFEKEGMTVTPLPAHFRTTGGGSFSWSALVSSLELPTSGSFHLSSLALKEYLGLLWYRALGR